MKKLTGYDGEARHIEAVKGEVREIVLDTRLAQKELGWRPKYTMEKGLKETVEWFKKKYKK